MKRKVIQIAVSTGSDTTGDSTDRLYALCDDGTIWCLDDKWDREPDIPQSGTASELKAQARQAQLRKAHA